MYVGPQVYLEKAIKTDMVVMAAAVTQNENVYYYV